MLPVLLSTALLLSACQDTGQSAAKTDSAQTAPAPATAEPAKRGIKPENGLISVNGEIIDTAMFALYQQGRQMMQPGKAQDPQQQVAALDELVNYTLLQQDAEAKGLAGREDVQIALELQRLELLAKAAVQQQLASNPVSEEAVKQRYEKEFSEPTTEYKARHILLETEDDARTVIAELDEGGDFEELAKSRSKGPSGPKGGDLGWFSAGRMVKPFSDAVAKMEKGRHSTDPVQTQFGWHVILLEDSREVPPPAMEQVEPKIRMALQQEALAAYMQQLRSASKIEVLQQPPGLKQPLKLKQGEAAKQQTP
jgi:peptidyl-prolyl cis-trans isomerase C